MKRNIIAITVLLILAICGNSHAALVTYTGGLTGQSSDPYPNNFYPLAQDRSIALTQFNSSMGTLNSITLDLSSVFNYGTGFENRSSSGSTVTKNIVQQLRIGSLLDTGLVNYNRTWSVAQYDGTLNYAGTSGFTVSENSCATNVHLTLTGAAMTAYIGGSDVLFDVFSHASFISGGFSGGNGSFMNTQNFVTTASVTYDYTPVPLPAAVWLLGSGLAGLVSLRRRMAK
jgi:hypothetical protein